MIDMDYGFETTYALKNAAYFFLIEGEVSVADEILEERDAVGILKTDTVTIKANKQSKLLIIDVPLE